MGVVAPIQRPMTPPPASSNAALGALQHVLNAPGADALLGGPWGALAAIRTLYHGTTAPAAANIVKSGFDLSRFGTGADAARAALPAGDYGRGVYLTPHLSDAQTYSYLARGAEPGPRSFLSPQIVEAQVDDKHLLDLSRQAALRTANPELADRMNQIARLMGKRGVMYPRETVVFDPSIIQNPTRRY